MEPKWKHDCENCVFMGQYTDKNDTWDYYWCPQNGHPTVVMRYGNKGEEYQSMSPNHLYTNGVINFYDKAHEVYVAWAAQNGE